MVAVRAGFLRPAAQLAVSVITAGDDDSEPTGAADVVSTTVDFLRALKADPDQVTVGAIGRGDCPATGVEAAVPPRLQSFAFTFGGLGVYYPLCAEHFGVAMQRIVGMCVAVTLLFVGSIGRAEAAVPAPTSAQPAPL